MLKRIIKIIYLPIAYLMLINYVVAESVPGNWQVKDDKIQQLYTSDNDGNRFSIIQGDTDVDFTLELTKLSPGVSANRIRVIIDSSQPLMADLQFTRQSKTSALLTILLDAEQKNQLMKQMIGGLELRLVVKNKNKTIASLRYSLLGFTANLNDFLIAREIGKLDYNWLAIQNKHKELVCYYAANVYVHALISRKENLSIENSLKNLPKTGILQLDDEVGPEIIRSVYNLPGTRIPLEPRGDKYAMYTNCIEQ